MREIYGSQLRKKNRAKVLPCDSAKFRLKVRLRRFLLGAFAAACMILTCTFSYCSIRTSASSGFKYYTGVTVESGTTLWDLAEEYIDYDHYKNRDSYISEVRSINHLDENCTLTAGQILILPYYASEYIP